MKMMNTRCHRYSPDSSSGRSTRPQISILKKKFVSSIVLAGILLLVIPMGCQMYSDVLIRPDYDPSLAIHAILSPQEGGLAYIKYSVPIDTAGTGEVPALPALTLVLYENGEKKKTFTRKSEGHYILEPGDPEILPDRDYHIRAENAAGEVVLQSEKERLPSLPEVKNLRFYQDTTAFPEQNFLDMDLNFLPQPGTSLHFRHDYSIDSGAVFIRGREEEYGRFSIRELYFSKDYPEGKLRETFLAATFLRVPPNEKNEYVNATRMWVDHLSPDLTRFIKEVVDLDEAQFDPFATRHPAYSNIDGGSGIFGLYNSAVEVILLE